MKRLFFLFLFPFLAQSQDNNSTITFSPFVQTGVSIPSGENGLLHQSRLFGFENLYSQYPEIFEIHNQQPNWRVRASHAFGVTFWNLHDKDSQLRKSAKPSGLSITLALQRFDVGMSNFHNGSEFIYSSSLDLIDWHLNLSIGPSFGDVFRVSPLLGFSLPISREMNAQLTATDQNGEVTHFTPDMSILRTSDFNLMFGFAFGYFINNFSIELRYDLNLILTDDEAQPHWRYFSDGRANSYGTSLNTFSLRFSYNLFSTRNHMSTPK